MMRHQNLYDRPLWQRRRQRGALIDEREKQSSQQSFHSFTATPAAAMADLYALSHSSQP